MKRVKVSYTYLLFLILMLYISKYSEIVIITLSILLHELSHIICYLLLRNKKSNHKRIVIEISMFGGVCNLDLTSLPKYKKVLIYLSGIFINLLLIIINKYFIINIYSNIIIKYNLLLLIFSLLPIYPLDGFRILKEFINDKYIRKISIFSIFIILIMNIYFKSLGLLIILIYLFLKQKKIEDEDLYSKLIDIKNNKLSKQTFDI